MGFLVDTQALLWWANDNPDRLGRNASTALEGGTDDTFVSLVTPWELAVKIRTGKLELSSPLERFFSDCLAGGFHPLPIGLEHIYRTMDLPLNHRDPFDRLLIAQSLVEDLPIISNDKAFDAYGVERIW